jgi:hypothetical protein
LGAFNGLTELIELEIYINARSEIIPGTFESLGNLEYLDISSNKLEHLDSDVFSGLVKLQYIILSRNYLQYVHPDTFLRSPNIKNVSLSANPDLQIPTDRNFINSRSLSKLDISHCNVSSLSVETFANVGALERLYLEDNNLRSVDVNILTALPKLSELRLYDNPLLCDCQLIEMLRWVQEIKIDTEFGECETSGGVELWWERGQSESGRVLKNNIQDYVDCNSTNYSYTDIKYTLTLRDTDSETELDTDSATELDTDTEQNGDDSNFLIQYQLPIYAVPVIFGTTCNVIILIIITRNKDMRTVPNMYILNLATSDIIYLTVLFSEACANTISDTWFYVEFVCWFLPFCRRLSIGLSAYSVAGLSVQWYRVTVNSLHVLDYSKPTRRVNENIIAGMLIVAAFFAIPSAISWYWCSDFCSFSNISYYKHVVIFELLVSCVIPLCVIAFTCIMTARHLVESYRPLSEGTQNPELKTRRNTARMVVGLTAVFLITNVPYHVFWTYHISTEEERFYFKKYDLSIYADPPDEPKKIYLILTCLLLLGCCFNPVALFCASSPLRKHLKHKTNSNPTEMELQTMNQISNNSTPSDTSSE